MTIKAKIHKRVSGSKIHSRVAPAFKKYVDATRLSEGPYTLLCFPVMKSDATFIVDSKSLDKALQKVQDINDPLVVVAHGFTHEAHELLYQKEIMAFFESDSHWTDERWAEIRDMP